MNNAIRIENVSKRFKNAVALNRVTFDIPSGEIFGLLGPNGAGKTTLMRILVGILGPDEGRIQISGKTSKRLKQRIGYLPEERGLYQKMKVKDLIPFCASMKGLSSQTIKDRMSKELERVGLAGEENKKIEELSKGNQQRLQLLVTLIHRPDFLILDEPLTGLDPIGVDRMKQILIEETERGATVIISTHRMEDAEQLCKSIALIHRGKVVRAGLLETIKQEEGRDELIVNIEGETASEPDIPGLTLIESSDHCLRFRLENDTYAPDIFRAIGNRLDVSNIQRATPTLHDIFVNLVGEEEEERS